MCSTPYLELQNDRPFFNIKSSLFRGNSPFFLHFQWGKIEKVGIQSVLSSLILFSIRFEQIHSGSCEPWRRCSSLRMAEEGGEGVHVHIAIRTLELHALCV